MYDTASNTRPFVATGPLHSFRIRSSWLELHAPRLPVVAMGLRDQARPTVPRLSQPLPSFHGPRPGGSDARMLGSGAHGHGCGMDVDRSTNCDQARRLASLHLREFLLDPLRRVCTDGRTASTGWKLGFDLGLKRGRSGLFPRSKGKETEGRVSHGRSWTCHRLWMPTTRTPHVCVDASTDANELDWMDVLLGMQEESCEDSRCE